METRFQKHEARRKRIEGLYSDLQRWNRKIINFIPVQLETGENVMACEDITERKQAEAALKESEGNTEPFLIVSRKGITKSIWPEILPSSTIFWSRASVIQKEGIDGLNNRHYMSPGNGHIGFLKTFNEV